MTCRTCEERRAQVKAWLDRAVDRLTEAVMGGQGSGPKPDRRAEYDEAMKAGQKRAADHRAGEQKLIAERAEAKKRRGDRR